MKYMMLFWVDESGETTADEDAAMMVAVKSWVDQMTDRGILVHGGALRSAGEAAIVHVRDGEVLVSDGPFAETKEQAATAWSSAPTWMRPSGSRPDIRWRGPPRSRCDPTGTRPGITDRFDCSFGCPDPRNCSQIADGPEGGI
jgi:YCII-related domain